MHNFELAEKPDIHHPTVRPFTTPVAGQFRTVLTRAPSAPRQCRLRTAAQASFQDRHIEKNPSLEAAFFDPERTDYHADQLTGSAKGI